MLWEIEPVQYVINVMWKNIFGDIRVKICDRHIGQNDQILTNKFCAKKVSKNSN